MGRSEQTPHSPFGWSDDGPKAGNVVGVAAVYRHGAVVSYVPDVSLATTIQGSFPVGPSGRGG